MKILIATDGSDYSRAAIEKCCEIAVKAENTAIKIVAAYQPYIPLETYMQSAQYSQEFERAMHRQAGECADEAAAMIRECFPDTDIELTTQVTLGAAEQVIIQTAEDWDADLIVVGSHGRGFWGRAMIGSVSDSVIHHAPCSVLVVRTAAAEKPGE